MGCAGSLTLTERELSRLWQRHPPVGRELPASGGRKVKVIYPGWSTCEGGPDFRDAIIATETGEMLIGDIEMHVKSSDWKAHGHHHNPNYNSVILHVVGRDDIGQSTPLENGKEALTLALEWTGLEENIGFSEGTLSARETPCRGVAGRLGAVEFLRRLEQAGKERFLEKAALFAERLREEQPEQILYQALMEALGYNRNREPFGELAGRLPLERIRALTSCISPDEVGITFQSLLFGTAGLLPSQRRNVGPLDPESAALSGKLELIWQDCKDISPMTEEDWRTYQVRPENQPVRRIAAAGLLLERYHRAGLLEAIMTAVYSAPLSGFEYVLERTLIVSADAFWKHHNDFDKRSAQANTTLLGTDRARDMIINVVLPFTYAWGASRLAKRSLNLYSKYPKLSENRITRQVMLKIMGEGTKTPARTAAQQQGLLHLDRKYCTLWSCSECPLGRGGRSRPRAPG